MSSPWLPRWAVKNAPNKSRLPHFADHFITLQHLALQFFPSRLQLVSGRETPNSRPPQVADEHWDPSWDPWRADELEQLEPVEPSLVYTQRWVVSLY